ncbi:MAG: hypothetical protein GWP67_09420 [Gammaproteobacteria bacterium]|jgi:hypothetical protein|nr:hypothetical protein [Gammaproteobacteria bacterium]
MVRNIAAGVAGALVAMGLVWIIQIAGHTVYPSPPDLDFTDTEAIRAYILTLPLGAFLFVGGAWFVGTLGGTMAACHVGTAAPRVFSIVVGSLMLLATAVNLATIPHPLWFSIAGIASIFIAAWLGMFLSEKANSP